jgi:hypothetical protein
MAVAKELTWRSASSTSRWMLALRQVNSFATAIAYAVLGRHV